MKGLTVIVGRVVATTATAAAVAVVLAGARVSLRAQTPSLGEVAKKEAERRKAQPNTGKVYTNKDLPASALNRPATPAQGTGTGPVNPVAAATEEKPAEQKPEEPKPAGETKDEAYWKGRVTAAREEVRRNEMFAEALQTRINSLSRDYVSRDNPAQRSRIGQDRSEALTELARVKQDVERGKKQIVDIEEEARKSGVPPGWLR